tara:strand:- start:189 stop:710 length:522 start_codon:yes stop_codon:yes gene_type:complete
MINLRAAMSQVSGASFVGIDTTTIPVLTKFTGTRDNKVINPMHGKVRKHMRGASVMVFQNKQSSGYANMVERRLVSEGKDPASFTLSPRAWGERVEGLPIVEHKGEEYLEVIFLKAGQVSYTLDGQPIAVGDIIGMKDASKGTQGGLDNKVIIRTFKAESIAALRINGEVIAA